MSDNKLAASMITGAVVDFMYHLKQLESPMIVGQDYPIERLVGAFKEWALKNNVSIENIDRAMWQNACKQGYFSQ